MAQPEYDTVLKLIPQNKLIHHLKNLNYIYLCSYMQGGRVQMYHVRREVLGAGPFFHHVSPRDQI